MSRHHAQVVERAMNSFSALVSAAENFTADWVNHDPSLPPTSELAGAEQLLGLWRTGFSNLKFQFEDSIEEGDKVAARFLITGTHSGSVLGQCSPAVGRWTSGAAPPAAGVADPNPTSNKSSRSVTPLPQKNQIAARLAQVRQWLLDARYALRVSGVCQPHHLLASWLPLKRVEPLCDEVRRLDMVASQPNLAEIMNLAGLKQHVESG